MRRLPVFPRLLLTILILALPAITAAQPSAEAMNAAGSKRLFVVYRNGAIPGDVEEAALRVGGRVLHRHERVGAALLTGSSAAIASVLQDPRVEMVVEDRAVQASSITLAPSALESRPVARTSAPSRPLPLDGPDAYYTASPQGWAVRAVGGFGGGVAGSPAIGPWSLSRGEGVRIAILDSGVDRTHPDIAPNLLLNITEVDRAQQPSPCDDGTAQDQSGHGTWVASLAAGAAGAGTGLTVGVAPKASLLNIKVLQRMPGSGADAAEQCRNGQPSGMLSWVLQGIEDAIAHQANIIVLSMATTLDLYSGDAAGVKTLFDRATHAAAEAGVVIVAAAGNDAFDFSNQRYMSLPAQSRDVLAVVASTNPDCAENTAARSTCAPGQVSMPYYSDFGAPLHAVAAPGGSYPLGNDDGVSGWVRGACSAGLPGTFDGLPSDANHSEGCFNLGHVPYAQAIGTSASAPLVAGVVALVKAAHPAWDYATVVAAVRASAVATGGMAYGVVNAAAALSYKPQ